MGQRPAVKECVNRVVLQPVSHRAYKRAGTAGASGSAETLIEVRWVA